jgi:diguanylate cyclase (GGDEF)-like protein/PAS domain S-box-containing protein
MVSRFISMTHSEEPQLKSLSNKINLLEGILDNLGAYIYSKDTDGCYTYVNQSVLNLFKKTREEVIGFDDSHFFDLTLSQQLKDNDQKVIRDAKPLESEETNYIKDSKIIHIFRTVKSPLFDENNEVIGVCGVSTDITQERTLQNTINKQKHLLNAVLDNIDSYIYMKDSERVFKYVNNKVAELFGDTAENIIGKKDSEVLPPETAEHFHKSDQRVFESGKKVTIEESSEDESGKIHHFISTKIPFQQQGEPPSLIGFSTDVTELFNLKEEFKKQANIEPLTGLFNRRYFVEHAEREFNRALRHSSNLALMSIDIDYFKNINDKYGHPAGDQVLIEVSKCLTSYIRNEDILARIGGEEFSILLPETTLQAARDVAERIRVGQSKMMIKGLWQGEINITVSIGISCLRSNDQNFERLFSRTDKALYIAKDLGRNAVYCLK